MFAKSDPIKRRTLYVESKTYMPVALSVTFGSGSLPLLI